MPWCSQFPCLNAALPDPEGAPQKSKVPAGTLQPRDVQVPWVSTAWAGSSKSNRIFFPAGKYCSNIRTHSGDAESPQSILSSVPPCDIAIKEHHPSAWVSVQTYLTATFSPEMCLCDAAHFGTPDVQFLERILGPPGTQCHAALKLQVHSFTAGVQHWHSECHFLLPVLHPNRLISALVGFEASPVAIVNNLTEKQKMTS